MMSTAATWQPKLRYPRLQLVANFAVWKALLLGLAVLSPGLGYDTSTDLLLSSVSSPYSHQSSSSVTLAKLLRWDAIYFTQIARRGYLYEQEWAFGWGYTTMLSLISRSERSKQM